jgi:putative ABC transport system substrate-binding protein
MRATSALPIVLFAVALERKLPSVGTAGIFVTAGGMLYYGPDFLKIIERTMSCVDRILRGAKPGDLPIEQPTNFQFIVNTKTARALGLKIPQAVLLRADRVIE